MRCVSIPQVEIAFARSRGVSAVICLGGNAELVCAAMRFLSPRLASVHAGAGGSVAVFCRRFTPVFFPLSGKKRRLAMPCVSIPRVEIATRAFSRRWRGYRAWRVHFGFGRFFMAISTGYRGRGNGGAGWRRGACASLRGHIGFTALSAGSTLGAARPQTCAKESSTLWTLFTLRRGCVGADSPRRRALRPHAKS